VSGARAKIFENIRAKFFTRPMASRGRRSHYLGVLRIGAGVGLITASRSYEIAILKPNAARCHSAQTERLAKICVTCHDETE